VIGGEVARGALRLATLLVLLSFVTLLFQDRSSAEFIVSVMALLVSVLFLAVVLGLMRFSVSRLPPRRDNAGSSEYNTARPDQRDTRGRET
jgi:hypothetical protein